MNNIYNVNENLELSMVDIFARFTEIYWNLIVKNHLNQIRKGRALITKLMGNIIKRNQEILRMPLLLEAFKNDFDGYRDERLPEMYKSAAFNGFEVGWEPKVS